MPNDVASDCRILTTTVANTYNFFPMSEGRTKVTKEVLCDESRFILANIMTATRIGGENRYHDIRRQCETAISIPFTEYVGFLEQAGYLRHERSTEMLEITKNGESIVNGNNLSELTDRAVAHFKSASRRRKNDLGGSAYLDRTPPPMISSSATPEQRTSIESRSKVERSSIDRAPPLASSMGASSMDRASMDRASVDRASVDRPSIDRPMDRSMDRSFDRTGERFGPSTGTASGVRNGMGTGDMPTSGDMLDSRYEKLATIGTGGIGTVYRARQVPLNREVALKEIRELFNFFAEDQRGEIVRRFTEVVRSAAQLAHPNIVPIHEVNLDREFPYVVTELSPNGSTRRLINDAENIPVDLVLKYLLQALHALQAAHAQRVYHRGLKPENLVIDAYGNVKISDFGFARIVERDAAVIRQVYVGMGNIAYMAPELYHDPVAAGPQTDIYALGIIFYELLTRRLPGRRSPMPSEINDALPRGIDDIFDRMTRDSRAERYSSVDDILDDINSIDGLSDVLDQQTQVLVAQNPLEQIKFREGDDPTAGTALPGAAAGDPAKGGTHRPYSYQQRRKR